MAKSRLVFLGFLAAIFLITLVQLLLPYRMPAAKNLVPELDIVQSESEKSDYLEQIFAHNLWSKDRTPLLFKSDTEASNRQSVSENQSSSEVSQDNNSWKLVGVSSEGQEPFAVIESNGEVQNYTQGDLLPDGALVDEILVYGIQISKSGKNERFYLFGKK